MVMGYFDPQNSTRGLNKSQCWKRENQIIYCINTAQCCLWRASSVHVQAEKVWNWEILSLNTNHFMKHVFFFTQAMPLSFIHPSAVSFFAGGELLRFESEDSCLGGKTVELFLLFFSNHFLVLLNLKVNSHLSSLELDDDDDDLASWPGLQSEESFLQREVGIFSCKKHPTTLICRIHFRTSAHLFSFLTSTHGSLGRWGLDSDESFLTEENNCS